MVVAAAAVLRFIEYTVVAMIQCNEITEPIPFSPCLPPGKRGGIYIYIYS
jgi:hypothetical protein